MISVIKPRLFLERRLLHFDFASDSRTHAWPRLLILINTNDIIVKPNPAICPSLHQFPVGQGIHSDSAIKTAALDVIVPSGHGTGSALPASQ